MKGLSLIGSGVDDDLPVCSRPSPRTPLLMYLVMALPVVLIGAGAVYCYFMIVAHDIVR